MIIGAIVTIVAVLFLDLADPSTTGTVGVSVVLILLYGCLALDAHRSTLRDWVPNLAFAVLGLTVLALFSPFTGPLTHSSNENGRQYAAEQLDAERFYTHHFQVTTHNNTCVLDSITNEVIHEEGPVKALLTEGGKCILLLDWDKTYTTVFPRRNGENGLNELGTPFDDPRAQPATTLMYTFPADPAMKAEVLAFQPSNPREEWKLRPEYARGTTSGASHAQATHSSEQHNN